MTFTQTIHHYISPLNRMYWLGQEQKESLYEIDGARFLVRKNTPDKYTLWESWKIQPYLEKGQRLHTGDVVVDIGANIGAFTVWAAREVGKSGKVLAFEPDRINYQTLARNIKLNKVTQALCRQMAVSDKLGKLTFYVQPAENSTAHSIYHDEFARKVSVRSTTLVEIFRREKLTRIDLLKIDAEGAEYPILYSTPKSVFKRIKYISLEYHDIYGNEHNAAALENFLRTQGYTTKLTKTKLNLMHWFTKMGYIRAWRE